MKDIKDRFIVSEDVSEENLREFAERTLVHGRVTKGGTIVIDNKKLTPEDTLKLALVIKYIANQFDETNSASLRPKDATTILNERIESVGSRLSKLAKEGFAKKVAYGQYSVFPYKIRSFLDHF